MCQSKIILIKIPNKFFLSRKGVKLDATGEIIIKNSFNYYNNLIIKIDFVSCSQLHTLTYLRKSF